MAGYSFHVPFYATGLRGDEVEAALEQVTPIASQYGATRWAVYRSQEDRYKFLVTLDFPSKKEFEAYWYGDEAREMRAALSGYFQNPVVYAPFSVVTEGSAVAASA
ncbi:MAG: hypothetical protein QM679_07820 [Patulibacter sp.]